MKPAIPFLALALLLAPGASGRTSVGHDERKEAEDFLRRVEARTPIVCRSLVVVPLVLNPGVAPGEAPSAKTGDLAWAPDGKPAKTEIVRVGPVPADPPPRLLPAGLLLEGGLRERILSRPLRLAPDEAATVVARPCDHEPAESAGDGVFGPVAPWEQRKLDFFIGEADVLEDLLRVQEALAGAVGKRVRDLHDAPSVVATATKVEEACAGLPGAFGGAVAGHVAFLGLRPVSLVLFREPVSYRASAGGYLKALGLSLSLYETWYPPDPAAKVPDPAALRAVAAGVLESLREGAVRERRGRARERGGGRTLLVLAREAEGRPAFAGRLLLGEDGVAWALDAYDTRGDLVFPRPLVRPGGPETGVGPNVSDGAVTKEFLRRLEERHERIREALGM